MKYAKDAGHDAIVELLGGEEEGEAWIEVEEVYTGTDAGEDGEASGPSGGLWIRHMDPQTGLAYYMNDETGERQIGKALPRVQKKSSHQSSGCLSPGDRLILDKVMATRLGRWGQTCLVHQVSQRGF